MSLHRCATCGRYRVGPGELLKCVERLPRGATTTRYYCHPEVDADCAPPEVVAAIATRRRGGGAVSV